VFDVGTFTRNLLINNSAITTLVSTSQILSSWPETFTVFPTVVFDDSQNDVEFVDNMPVGSNAVVSVDVFIKDDTPTPIAIAICDAFKAELWSCEYNHLVPDPDASIRHRSMRFSRPLVSGDI
jgi:hypothetical protein